MGGVRAYKETDRGSKPEDAKLNKNKENAKIHGNNGAG